MELILVLPVILLVFFACVQIAYFWLTKQLLQYAAYTAARTTLVTNVQEYANVDKDTGNVTSFFHAKGPLYRAATMVMSWMEADEGNADFQYFPNGDNQNEKKASTARRIRISGSENSSGNLCVEVTVYYYCPVWMPMVDEILGYAMAGGTQQPNDYFSAPEDYEEVIGTIQTLPAPAESIPPNAIYLDKAGTLLLRMHETCLMAKPYSTITYGRPEKNEP